MTSILNRGSDVYDGPIYDYHPGDIDVTTLADGSYVVVWSSSDNFGNGIYMRHYDANGLPRGLIFAVSNSGNVQTHPSIAALPDGGYAVTYIDGAAHNLILRAFNASDVDYYSSAGLTGDETASTSLSNGGHAVAFTFPVAVGSMAAGVYLSVYSSAGQWTLTKSLMNTSGNVPINPTIAGLDNGTIVAAWAEVAPSTGFLNIFTRTYSDTGSALGAVTQVETAIAFNRIRPDIVALDSGYVITWQEDAAGGDQNVYGQVMDDNGAPVGTGFMISAAGTGSQSTPSVAALDDGGFVAVWTAFDSDGSGTNIYARHFDAEGHAFGPDERVNTVATGDQDLARVTGLAGGGYVVVWNNESTGAVSSRIYTTATSLNGTQVLYGTGEADVLDGGSGNDIMYGGWGDDTYVVNAAGDSLVEDALGGNDTVMASLSYTLGSNLENLTLTGSSPLNGTGNAAENVLIGNSGANILSGLDGGDTIDGGAGNDTLNGGLGDDVINGGNGNDVIQASDGYDIAAGDSGIDTYNAVTGTGSANINLTTGKSLQNGYITYLESIENATGSALGDSLTGNSGDNILNGSTGADAMSGGLGDDTYIVENIGDVVTESSNGALGGIDTIYSNFDITLSNYVENLILTGTAIIGNGEGHANTITGNASDNLIDGKAGDDTMTGGLGDDTYWVDTAGDTVTELAGQGTDTVRSVITYSLGVNVENLVLTGTGNTNATGNAGANSLTGNAGDNVLDGAAGADVMAGGNGNDTYYVDNATDNVVEADLQGTDTIVTTASYTLSGRFIETLQLSGGGNINATGNSKANTLISNAGNNSLTGGGGADIFSFALGNAADTIIDFNSAQGDSIDATAYHAVSHSVTLSGTSVIIDFGGGNTVTVLHATVSDVTAHTVF